VISEAKLREIEARAEAATPGPWEIGVAVHAGVVAFNGDDISYVCATSDRNKPFIAASRTDIPALSKALREAAEIIAFLSERDAERDPELEELCVPWMREWRGESEKQGEV